MAQKQVELPQIGLVKLTKRRGNSNIRLSFARDGSIRVSLPYYVPYSAGLAFVKSRRVWLEKNRPIITPVIQDGDRIGKYHRMRYITKMSAAKASVRIKDRDIVVTLPNSVEIDEELAITTAERGAHKALKLETDSLLPKRLDDLAKKNGFQYKTLSSKRLVSRWGSCSSTKDIVLNIYLMQLPWELIDYVILHELVHTEHLNHSDKFWERFEQVLPGAKSLRKQLKNHKTVITPINI